VELRATAGVVIESLQLSFAVPIGNLIVTLEHRTANVLRSNHQEQEKGERAKTSLLIKYSTVISRFLRGSLVRKLQVAESKTEQNVGPGSM
jgi:hypothetical protein